MTLIVSFYVNESSKCLVIQYLGAYAPQTYLYTNPYVGNINLKTLNNI